jgi:hypothetical protein
MVRQRANQVAPRNREALVCTERGCLVPSRYPRGPPDRAQAPRRQSCNKSLECTERTQFGHIHAGTRLLGIGRKSAGTRWEQRSQVGTEKPPQTRRNKMYQAGNLRRRWVERAGMLEADASAVS